VPWPQGRAVRCAPDPSAARQLVQHAIRAFDTPTLTLAQLHDVLRSDLDDIY
jgi:hypothetical protein